MTHYKLTCIEHLINQTSQIEKGETVYWDDNDMQILLRLLIGFEPSDIREDLRYELKKILEIVLLTYECNEDDKNSENSLISKTSDFLEKLQELV